MSCNKFLSHCQTVQQQLLTQTVTDQAAEGNEEKSMTEESLLQVKRR